ncbi:MAG: hypothetical protein ACRBI6_00325 [Acidimicrobiales bacterium]
MSVAPAATTTTDLPALEHIVERTIDLRDGVSGSRIRETEFVRPTDRFVPTVDSLVLVDLLAEEEALAFAAGAVPLGPAAAARLSAVESEIDARWDTFLSR